MGETGAKVGELPPAEAVLPVEEGGKETRMDVADEATPVELQNACGSLDPNLIEDLVSKVCDCSDKQKGIWLKGTIVTKPEPCPDVTYKKGRQRGAQKQKVRVWIEDFDKVRTRITFLADGARALTSVMKLHQVYYFGELTCAAVDTKWVTSGLEFTGYDCAQPVPVPKATSTKRRCSQSNTLPVEY